MRTEERVPVRFRQQGGSVVVRIPAAASQSLRRALAAVCCGVPSLPAEEKGVLLCSQEGYEAWLERSRTMPEWFRRALRPILLLPNHAYLSPSGRELRLAGIMAVWGRLGEEGELLLTADGRLLLRGSRLA